MALRFVSSDLAFALSGIAGFDRRGECRDLFVGWRLALAAERGDPGVDPLDFGELHHHRDSLGPGGGSGGLFFIAESDARSLVARSGR